MFAFAEAARRPARAVAAPADRAEAERRNLLDVSWAMVVCALFREESRGGHFRTDFPDTDDVRFRAHTFFDGEAPRTAPVDEPLPGGAC